MPQQRGLLGREQSPCRSPRRNILCLVAPEEERMMSTEQDAADDPGSTATVDVGDQAAIERWTRALGLTDAALMKAVQVVGPRVDRIKDYLGAGGMAGDQSDA